jgi:hypothetical protein
MTDRVPCCIPSCRRSFREDRVRGSSELICGKCWRTIDKRLRERHKLIRKRMRQIERLLSRKVIQARFTRRDTLDASEERFHRLAARAWDACKMDATIKAMFGVERRAA